MGQQRQRIKATEKFDDTPWLKACGRVLDAACRTQGLSSAVLSPRIGIAPSSIGYLRQGKKWLKPKHLLHLASIVQVSLSRICPDDPQDPDTVLLQRVATASPLVKEMVRKFLDILDTIQHSSSSDASN